MLDFNLGDFYPCTDRSDGDASPCTETEPRRGPAFTGILGWLRVLVRRPIKGAVRRSRALGHAPG
ncbi:hypothetical protein SAMN02745223_00567 [Devosia limi DSM 17137]|uniref:Uncharacterized protein n=1 Tax=Devosia limi DSM 17137 TaxID=1121477 RepID=A0A1M4U0G6_9HYPH|nr:hypothetical protein SAMN02745223_00567 [Devosia limi DSM 17137]